VTTVTDRTGLSDFPDEIAELREIGRRLDPGTLTWDSPPQGLWERIAAEVAETTPFGDGRRVEEASGGSAEVRSIDTARRSPQPGGTRNLPWLLAAAAAVVAVVAVGALWALPGDDATVLAASELDRLGEGGEGSAELVERDGRFKLRVHTAGIDPGDGFVEVWVIDTEVSQLVSLGPLREDGVYQLPEGIDPETFPIVDVSVEPGDGDPTHSGDSRLRGELQF
jgi:hypothetical protein